MNTTTAAVGTGAIVVLGRWSEGDDINVRIVIGVVFLALALAVLPEKVSRPFGWLILAVVVYRYAPGLISRSGLTQGSPDSNRPRSGRGGTAWA